MKGIITFAVDAKGKRTELLGSDKGRREHRDLFNSIKTGSKPMPKGAVRIEQYELQRIAIGIDGDAQRERLDGLVVGLDGNCTQHDLALAKLPKSERERVMKLPKHEREAALGLKSSKTPSVNALTQSTEPTKVDAPQAIDAPPAGEKTENPFS